MRRKRSFYNLVFGIIGQVFTIVIGIIIPRLFLVNFGSEVNGLMSSINQLFVYISLLEAGVGVASVQALYKPISEDDKERINKILSATSIYYKRVGKYYLILIIILAIIYPYLISSELDKLTIGCVIILTGLVGVINFFFQGKYKLLLNAEGKNYINTSIVNLVNILTNISKIILLLMGFNIIAVQLSYLIINLVQLALIKIYISLNYKWIDLTVEPDFKAISQKNSVLTHQIAGMIFNNSAILILSFLCGFKVASVYTMYSLLFNIIEAFVNVCNNSIVAALGQIYQTNLKRFILYFEIYEFIYYALVFSLGGTLYILILPFMEIYTNGISDINYINALLPLLFVIMKILNWLRTPCLYVINFAGHFSHTQKRAIIEALISIISSVILVFKFGIYGVLIGNILAYIYSSQYTIKYANSQLLDRDSKHTYIIFLLNICLLGVAIMIIKSFSLSLSSYVMIIFCGVIILISLLFLFLMSGIVIKRKFILDIIYPK